MPVTSIIRSRRLAALTAAPVALTGFALAGSAPASAVPGPTFTVNSTGDAPDAGRNGVCQTATRVCTLRAALMEAGYASTAATINFSIPGSAIQKINIGSPLPFLTNAAGTTINGYSQPGSRANSSSLVSNAVIKIDIIGKGWSGFDGLVAKTDHNVIKGIAIHNFKNQIQFTGLNADNNKVLGSFVCTDPTGTARSTANSGQIGILMQKGASGNTIGTSSAADRNVISGCGNRGVSMSYSPTSYNVIQNNIIGLNPSGTAALRNWSQGVDINYTNYNTVRDNVLSGNGGSGVEDSHGGLNHHNMITNNLIGATPSGSVAGWAGNLLWGLRFEGPKFCATPGHENPSGCTKAGVAEGLPHDNTATGNVIVSNGKGGVLIDKGHNTVTLSGNWIGATKSGVDGGNGVAGVQIQRGSYGALVQSNVVAHNPVGIQISSTGGFPPGNEQRTYSNRISRNSTFDNTGITFVFKTSPSLVQDAMVAPQLTAAPGRVIKGTTCANCTVELFVGENKKAKAGKTYLTTVKANSAGAFSATIAQAGGTPITATSTNTKNSTSPFQVPVLLKN